MSGLLFCLEHSALEGIGTYSSYSGFVCFTGGKFRMILFLAVLQAIDSEHLMRQLSYLFFFFLSVQGKQYCHDNGPE